ncbi:uncharacterized protein [Chamaea fasciata]|uniref:uncharacterized protein n=1 Tax=Chamaea fasciata TaxID=190680 RepID=UPI00336AC862
MSVPVDGLQEAKAAAQVPVVGLGGAGLALVAAPVLCRQSQGTLGHPLNTDQGPVCCQHPLVVPRRAVPRPWQSRLQAVPGVPAELQQNIAGAHHAYCDRGCLRLWECSLYTSSRPNRAQPPPPLMQGCREDESRQTVPLFLPCRGRGPGAAAALRSGSAPCGDSVTRTRSRGGSLLLLPGIAPPASRLPEAHPQQPSLLSLSRGFRLGALCWPVLCPDERTHHSPEGAGSLRAMNVSAARFEVARFQLRSKSLGFTCDFRCIHVLAAGSCRTFHTLVFPSCLGSPLQAAAAAAALFWHQRQKTSCTKDGVTPRHCLSAFCWMASGILHWSNYILVLVLKSLTSFVSSHISGGQQMFKTGTVTLLTDNTPQTHCPALEPALPAPGARLCCGCHSWLRGFHSPEMSLLTTSSN